MPSVIVIGARRARQGIGPFVTRWLHAAGAEIRGVVGTEPETITLAQERLARDYGIRTRGYVSVEVALETERPDALVICSPTPFHREQLARAADAGVDCLCEKPLWWGESADRGSETERLIDAFLSEGKILGTLTQWPFTLPAFYDLHPDVRDEPLERFEMHLGPISRGPRMILDSASHPISMLQALAGPGRVDEAQARFPGEGRGRLETSFRYRHARGDAEVEVRLATCPEAPRPAGYAINGRAVERDVDPADYTIYFEHERRRVPVEDPVKLLVEDFLARIAQRRPYDRRFLIEGMVHLDTLHAATNAALTPMGSIREDRADA